MSTEEKFQKITVSNLSELEFRRLQELLETESVTRLNRDIGLAHPELGLVMAAVVCTPLALGFLAILAWEKRKEKGGKIVLERENGEKYEKFEMSWYDYESSGPDKEVICALGSFFQIDPSQLEKVIADLDTGESND